jgi:hypothetical protein
LREHLALVRDQGRKNPVVGGDAITRNEQQTIIGGAEKAAELDAKRAIHQGVTLAAKL